MIRIKKAVGLLAFLAVLIHASPLAAQKTKKQLKREREQNVKKIQETERILNDTKARKTHSLGELNALNERIGQQQSLVQSIQNEINLLNMDIRENTQIIDALDEDLKLLKKEYASMLFSAQKASGKLDKLMLLFSSESFAQLALRLRYMEQYSVARKNQARVIVRVQRMLADQVAHTEQIREEKRSLRDEQLSERQGLVDLRKRQRSVVEDLEQQEQKLKADLARTQRAIAQLDRLIGDIIRKEMERAAIRKKAEKAVFSGSFERNKARFSWPVSGFISQRFGTQRHPVLKGIQIHNDGINIQTRVNEPVHAIFKGEVRAVAFIPSIGNSVIIGHGEYFTVYSGLKDVLVKARQQVSTRQQIGRVLANADGVAELRFQIRRNTIPINPSAWLKK